MGCFFACFTTHKHPKRRPLVNVTSSKDQIVEDSGVLHVTEWIKEEETVKAITESREKVEEPISCSNEKKVTLDLNVKTSEESLVEEVPIGDNLEKSNEKKESEEITKEIKFVSDLVTDSLLKINEKQESEEKEETPKEIKLVSDLVTPDVISYRPNHIYQNCETSDDEYEDPGLEESKLDDDKEGGNSGNEEKILVQGESSESLFSLSIESRKQVCEVELGEKEVNSPMPICCANPETEEIGLSKNGRDRSQNVHSVLNPVENLAQWQVLKARAKPQLSKYQDKENFSLVQDIDIPICPEPTFKLSTRNSKVNSNIKKVAEQEIAVDTSLSTWLFESEATPMSKASTDSVGNTPAENANSLRSPEDRPILGGSTVEELNQLSASATPTRSRSRSPEEPVIGTVGSYWKHTGKIIDSDSGSSSQGMPKTRSKKIEDDRVKSHSIPFEARLERALGILGVAKV